MKKKVLSLVLAVALCFSNILVSAEISPDVASAYLEGVIDVISKNYKYGIEKEELYRAVLDYMIRENPEDLEGAFKAATDVLDSYSEYYNADELASFVTNVHQSYVGIGITVEKMKKAA